MFRNYGRDASRLAQQLNSLRSGLEELDSTKINAPVLSQELKVGDTPDLDFSEILDYIDVLEALDTGLSGGMLTEIAQDMARDVASTDKRNMSNIREVLDSASKLDAFAQSFKTGEVVSHLPGLMSRTAERVTDNYRRMRTLLEDDMMLSIDSRVADSITSDIDSMYGKYQQAVIEAQKANMDGQAKIAKEKADLARYYSAQMEKQQRLLEQTFYNARNMLQLSELLDDRAEAYPAGLMGGVNRYLDGSYNIFEAIKKGDVAGAISSVNNILKERQKAKMMSRSSGALAQSAGKFSKLLLFMKIFELVIKYIKQVVGALVNVNNRMAEFKGELTKLHGIASLGISLTPDFVPGDMTKKLHAIHEMMSDFGFDTGTFIKPDQLMAMTGAMEQQGLKISELTSSNDKFKNTMLSIIKASVNSGMGVDQLATDVADYQVNMGLDIEQINGMLGYLANESKDQGIPMRMLYEGIKNSNYSLSDWISSAVYAVNMQKKAMQDSRMSPEAGKKGADILLNNMQNMNEHVFSVLAQHVGTDEMRAIAQRTIARKREMASMTTDDQARGRYNLQASQLEIALSKGDDVFFKRILKNLMEPEEIGVLLKKAVQRREDFGRITKEMQMGSYSSEIEAIFRGLLDMESANPSEFNMVMEAMRAVFFDNPDLGSSYSKLVDQMRKNKATQDAGQKNLQGYFQQTTKLSDMLESVLIKYLGRVLRGVDSMISSFKTLMASWWYRALGGTPMPDSGVNLERMKSDVIDLAAKANAETDENTRSKLMSELAAKSKQYAESGGSIAEVLAQVKKGGATSQITDILEKNKQYQKTVSGDSNIGTQLELSQGWVDHINSLVPENASRIIKALNEGAQKYGIQADLMAAQLKQESGFRTNVKSDSGALGIAQFMPITVKDVGGLTEQEALSGIEKPIDAMFRYRIKQRDRYEVGDSVKHWTPSEKNKAQYMAYNTGHGKYFQYYNAAKKALGRAPANMNEILQHGGVSVPEHRNYPGSAASFLPKYGNAGAGNTPTLPKPVPPPITAPPKARTTTSGVNTPQQVAKGMVSAPNSNTEIVVDGEYENPSQLRRFIFEGLNMVNNLQGTA